ncbi:MAG: ABC transporter permease [Propionibacteriaceae bacterium]|jgi:simple sugar transport system permease protein|nr:ABC transporter permease [Propionibacteriaceae bacterium]
MTTINESVSNAEAARRAKPDQGSPQIDHEFAGLAPRSWKAPIIFTVLTLAGAVVFCLTVDPGSISKVSVRTGTPGIGDVLWSLPSLITLTVMTVIMVAMTAWAWRQAIVRHHITTWYGVGFGLIFVAAFLVWAVSGEDSALQVTALLSGALFLSVPLIFGAMAGAVCEHVGVINVSIEGQLLGGAFLGAVVGSLTQNAWIGLLAAPVAGALVGCLLALFAVRYWVDHIIVGVVLNVLVTGLTNYLFSTVLTANSDVFSIPFALPVVRIPLLADIPVIGTVLFNQSCLVYIMYAVVILLQIMMFHSRWGLRMRACGEHPRAADTVGIKVNRTRVLNTILGGAIAGLGGAFFTLATGLAFGKEMSAGRGYIALAAMILGGWKPKGALLAALLFGFADNLQNALGVVGIGVPSQFMLMAPYLVTILAVAGIVGTVRAPAQEGTAYKG